MFLESPLESIQSVNGIVPSLDIITPVAPPYKGNIFKKEGSVAHLLSILLNAHCIEIGFESPNKVVNLIALLTSLKIGGMDAFAFSVVVTWTAPPLAIMAMHTLICASRASGHQLVGFNLALQA